jgi:hypothetical protein
MVDQVLKRQRLKRRVVASVPMFMTAMTTVAQSNLAATVPSRLAAKHGKQLGLAVFDAPLKIDPFTISLCNTPARPLISGSIGLPAGFSSLLRAKLTCVDGRGGIEYRQLKSLLSACLAKLYGGNMRRSVTPCIALAVIGLLAGCIYRYFADDPNDGTAANYLRSGIHGMGLALSGWAVHLYFT